MKFSRTSLLLLSRVRAQKRWTICPRTVQRITMILSLFLVAAGLGPADRGTHFSVAWQSSQNRTAHGLSLYALSEQGSISRLLIEGPGLQLVSLTKVIDANRGERKIRFADGISGWWIELSEDYETSWPSLRAALSSIAEGPGEGKEGSVISITLRTSDGFDFESILPWRLGGFGPELIVALEDHKLRRVLARTIPSSIREVTNFLTDVLAREIDPSRRVGSENGILLDLCEWALEVDKGRSEPRDEDWALAERGDFHRGITLADPEMIELVAKFPSLENVDPMRGMRPADLFPPDDPER